jgi:hypothetical protein
MSAYIVSPRTIKALVQYGGSEIERWQNLSRDQIVELLYDQNRKSVSARYNEKESETEKGEYLKAVPGRGWEYLALPNWNPVDILKIAACWKYQSCEDKDYESSKAWKIVTAIEKKAIRSLPGYDDAPWGLPDEEPEETVIDLYELAKKRGRGL